MVSAHRLSPVSTRPSELRLDINGLRAVAVLSVLFFHFNVPLISGGFSGVDVFFVISGFLMTKIIWSGLSKNSFQLLAFYKARLARIAPALFAMVCCLLIFGWLFVDPLAYRDVGLDGVSALLFFSNFRFFATSGYFAPAASDIWLLHTWSLSVEWQFYLVYPIVLLFLHRVAARRLRMFVLVGFFISFALTSGFAFIGGGRLSAFLFYMFPARAWEMLLGGCVFLWSDELRRFRSRYVEAIGLFVIAASTLFFTAGTAWPSVWTLVPAIGTALVMVADQKQNSVLGSAPLQTIGSASYSVYLWHWPILVGLRYFGLLSAWELALGLIASLAVGYTSFRFLESPAKRYVSAMRWGEFSRAAVVCSLAIAGCVAGWIVAREQGFPERSTTATQGIILSAMAAQNDWGFPTQQCDGLTRDGEVRVCHIGHGATKADRVFIGDSHAQMWYSRLDYLAKDPSFSIDVVTMAGCPPIPGIGKLSNPKCGTYNAALERYLRTSSYKYVVASAAWDGVLQTQSGDASFCLIENGGCASSSPEIFRAGARDRWKSFVQELTSRGQSVAVFLPSVTLPFDVPRRIGRDAFWGWSMDAYKSWPLADLKRRSEDTDAFLEAMASENVAVISTDGWCGPASCPLIDDKQNVLFKDDNHLRSSFVRDINVLDRAFSDGNVHTAER